MTEKFKVSEWLGGGEPIVTIACRKADWVEVIKAGQENAELRRQLAAREAELADRDARIADMREILQDVLSDCFLSDGMRNEIEKRISGKESGK